MAKTITALFDNYPEAQRAVQDLVDHGFDRNDISLISQKRDDIGGASSGADYTDETSGAATGAGVGAAVGGVGGLLIGLTALAIPGVGPIIAAGPIATALVGAGVGAAAGGLIGALTDMGVPDEDAGYYAEGVRRGSVLVAVRTDDDMVDRAVSILGRYNPIDIDERVGQWRQSGWSRFDPDAEPYVAPVSQTQARIASTGADATAARATTPPATRVVTETTTTERQTARPAASAPREPVRQTAQRRDVDKEETIEIVEEEVQVGKREVQRGGVRIHTNVVETPVTEQVRLREEHVSVERRPVDRPVAPGDREAFREDTIELTETGEEAVVRKQARVVEEVVVRKDVEEHVETVRDTVRRTDVDVERVGAEHARDFTAYNTGFRTHYQSTFSKGGRAYDYYEPAYRYGYTMANDPRYTNRDWASVETEARTSWEQSHRGQGAWEDFKDAIRHSWDTVRGRR